MSDTRALIAGGGIGGLSAALALSRAGLDVVVLERSARFAEIGAGIQLAPNAFHALDALGVGEDVRERAVFIERLQMMDALTAAEIAHFELGDEFRRHYRNPYAVVHRGDLYSALLAACRRSSRIDLRAGSDVTGYRQDASGVDALLASGDSVAGDLLIGADGLWSSVRRQLVGDDPPRVSGHTTYRSVIPTERMPEDLRLNAVTLWAGPRCHLVHYPLSDWKVFNLVVTIHNDATEAAAGVPVDHEEVLRGFDIHPRPQALIHHGDSWRKWVLCDRDPIEAWVDGRVALLGDAAHPMLQYFAQGACMAMEDAVALADTLARGRDSIGRALLGYRDRRLLRTTRVQLQSRAIGEHIYHPSGPHATLRDDIMRAKTQQDWYDVFDWLYLGPSERAADA